MSRAIKRLMQAQDFSNHALAQQLCKAPSPLWQHTTRPPTGAVPGVHCWVRYLPRPYSGVRIVLTFHKADKLGPDRYSADVSWRLEWGWITQIPMEEAHLWGLPIPPERIKRHHVLLEPGQLIPLKPGMEVSS